MKAYPSADRSSECEFIDGSFPKDFKPDYESSLFNSKQHRVLQSEKNWRSFHIIRKVQRKVIASIHFCIKEGVASSPLSAPFGSFELSESVTTSQLFEFISYYEKELIELGAKRVVIKNYPEEYHSRFHNLLAVLFVNHNYSIRNAELGACLKVDDAPFNDRIDPWEKRKLKKAIKEKLIFRRIPNNRIQETFQFIQNCREERGHSLSMTSDELSGTVKKLGDYFYSFGVFHKNELVAASISIQVNKAVLYNFYSAHRRESDPMSPVVFLIGEMYAWCRAHNIKTLDLGTSALGGKPNFSLIDFKLRLGATPTMKLTFEKELK